MAWCMLNWEKSRCEGTGPRLALRNCWRTKAFRSDAETNLYSPHVSSFEDKGRTSGQVRYGWYLLTLVLWKAGRTCQNGDTTLPEECGSAQLMCFLAPIAKMEKEVSISRKEALVLIFGVRWANTVGTEAAAAIWYLPYPSQCSKKFQDNLIYESWSN